jgi:hypothetical protein
LCCDQCGGVRWAQTSHSLHTDATTDGLTRANLALGGANWTMHDLPFNVWWSSLLLSAFRVPSTLPSICETCKTPSTSSLCMSVQYAAPLMFFNVSEWSYCDSIQPRTHLRASDGSLVTYRLFGVIYHGENHWTCRYVTQDGKVWYHDGARNHGIAVQCGSLVQGAENFCDVRWCNGRKASKLLYVLNA